MTSKRMACTSCGRKVETEATWVEFPCPGCAKIKIIRCERCKSVENPYVCSECSFRGP